MPANKPRLGYSDNNTMLPAAKHRGNHLCKQSADALRQRRLRRSKTRQRPRSILVTSLCNNVYGNIPNRISPHHDAIKATKYLFTANYKHPTVGTLCRVSIQVVCVFRCASMYFVRTNSLSTILLPSRYQEFHKIFVTCPKNNMI